MSKDNRIMKNHQSVRIDHLVSIIAFLHKKDGAAIQDLRQERNQLKKETPSYHRGTEFNEKMANIKNQIDLLYARKQGLGRLVAYLNAYTAQGQQPFTINDLDNVVEESNLEVGKKAINSLLQAWISA